MLKPRIIIPIIFFSMLAMACSAPMANPNGANAAKRQWSTLQ